MIPNPTHPAILSMKEDYCSDSTAEEDNDEAAKHATALVGGGAAAETGEERQEGEHHQEDDDEGEVVGRGVLAGEGRLYVLAENSVLGVQEDVDGPGEQCGENEEKQKIYEEENEFNEVCTAPSHSDILIVNTSK